MHRFYVKQDQIVGNQIILLGTDVNHIVNVLRMRPGEQILLCDGARGEYRCMITEMTKSKVVATIQQSKETENELQTKLYLFQGIPKKDKMEWIIQKAVELGVHQIIPVKTKRTIVQLETKEKEEKKRNRWNRIAESAAKQSGRGYIPTVTAPCSFEKAIQMAQSFPLNLIPYEKADDFTKTKAILQNIKQEKEIGVFIGPEGGYEETEIAQAQEKGVIPITLGKRILRTETAGIVMLSLLMAAVQ